ncbi:MAG: cytidine deaminase [Bacteroidales bacterium]|nr:cytidine deaminase [Bacteroidales bacterium]MDD2280094.1 cytidine deaminase [Bacteroidales bacterium]MDD4293004.1 cytidine deaminase [Bacteroidales bacterium]MDD4491202.1 cytidine deaminase [Bacteroidales bacterium]HNW49129.1 cytidine deaminase [Bacteroidales bacterium]
MCQKSISISYKEYFRNEGLELKDKELLDRAKIASEGAYAPYSNFNVGAAVRLSNGEIIAASNQENAAYPSGLCAERVAIFYAHAKFPDASVESIAVTASVGGHICETPTYPCGACRQVLAESEMRSGSPIRVIVGGEKFTQVMDSISALLPFTFDNLPKR